MKGIFNRSINLDFHNSPEIPGIAANFDEEEFREALLCAGADSINLFAKCHHGMFYYRDSAFAVHPHLEKDLLPLQIGAARRAGMAVGIYISAGLDENAAFQHPEWTVRRRDGSMVGSPDFLTPGYHQLCFGSPYLDLLKAQIREIVGRFPAERYFLDICQETSCHCNFCISALLERGEPLEEESFVRLGEETFSGFCREIRALFAELRPEAEIYFNGGHNKVGRRELIARNTYLAIESLPTGHWGYDHFPKSAAYLRLLGMDYLGMTAKFHTEWGEFGGFKHSNALCYETALCQAYGAKCCVGEQLHPDGRPDGLTFSQIGAAYARIRELEPWRDGESAAEVGYLCLEGQGAPCDNPEDVGAARILRSCHFLFDMLDEDCPFDKYRLLVLPDGLRLTQALKAKLARYLEESGRILCFGTAPLAEGGFAFRLGAAYRGVEEASVSYALTGLPLRTLNGSRGLIVYRGGTRIQAEGEILMEKTLPLLERNALHFSSHQHAPADESCRFPAATRGEDGIYCCWPLFSDYAERGELSAKDLAEALLLRGLEDAPALKTDLPGGGDAVLSRDGRKSRYFLHLVYAARERRGRNSEVVEDEIPLYDIRVGLRLPGKIVRVCAQPGGTPLPFQRKGDYVETVLPVLRCHAALVFEGEEQN